MKNKKKTTLPKHEIKTKIEKYQKTNKKIVIILIEQLNR